MNPNEINTTMANFRGKRIGHRIAATIRGQIMMEVLTAERERVVALMGPTGVGKSVVIERVRTLLIEHFRSEMDADPGFLPFLYLSTKTGYGADFNWKDLHARLLNEAQEVLIRKKKTLPRLELDGQLLTTTRGLVTDELGRAFESVVKNRRVRIVFFDEASAMIDQAVNKNAVRQFNILKSHAVNLGVVIVLIGAYDLMGLNAGNGQLIRRCEVIHMPRYGFDRVTLPSQENKSADEDEFVRAIESLSAVAPVQIEEDAVADERFVLAKSVGCVGIFRDWLDRACVKALAENKGVLTKVIFEAAALPNWKVRQLTEEAILGEKALTDCGEQELAKILGVESIRTPHEQGDELPAKRSGKKSGRVGQRGPSRDRVGGLHA